MKLKEQEILNRSQMGWRKSHQGVNSFSQEATGSPVFKGSRFREYTSPHSGFSHSSPQLRVNNSFNKKPLRQNSSELSFKGFSLKNVVVKNHEELLQRAEKVIGKTVRDLFEEVSKHSADRIVKNGDEIIFKNKSIGRLFVESAVYPLTRMPFDLIDFSLGLLKKVPFLKEGAEKAFNSPFLTKQRTKLFNEEQFNAVAGMLDQLSKKIGENASSEVIDNWLFKASQRNFGIDVGKYNSVHERSLNRVVTGMIPAFFLANDAYNLSRYCDDDSKLAKKEQKTRFRQEATRVFGTAYMTLIALGALTKIVNGSKMGSVLIATIPVLISEIFSRLINGKSIIFVSKDIAAEKAKKAGIVSDAPVTQENEDNKNPKVTYKYYPVGVTFSKSEKVFSAFKGKSHNIDMQSFKSFEPVNPDLEVDNNIDEAHKSNKNKTNGLFTLSGLRNAIIASIAIGYGLKFAKKNVHFNKLLNGVFAPFKEAYNKLTQRHYSIKRKDFEKVTEAIKNAGFTKIAKNYVDIIEKHEVKTSQLLDKLKELKQNLNLPQYQELIKYNKDLLKEFKVNLDILPSHIDEMIATLEKAPKDEIRLSSVNSKSKALVDLIIAPFKFLWQTVSCPYTCTNNIIKGITSKFKKPNEISDIDLVTKSLQELLDKVQHTKNPAEFEKYLANSMVGGFNNITKSDYSNTDMANLNKLFTSTITSYFLIADDYNMVMTKSSGSDADGAVLKSKERIIQRISAMFYQLMFMQLFNTTFKKTYHSSLLGMSAVCSGNTVATEYFTRASIGKPVVPMSRDEIKSQERKNNSAKGIKGAYFRFMSQLTGKKSIGEDAKKKSKVA